MSARYFVTADEEFPVFDLELAGGTPSHWPVVEVADEFVARFEAAQGEWRAVQIELRRMAETARTARRQDAQ